MGVMYAWKCDLCGEVQVKENPHEIQGTSYMENGVQKFSCAKCKSLLKAAFEIKKGGLRKPLSKVAGLVEERDQARRERDEAQAALEGKAVGIGGPHSTIKPGKSLEAAARIAAAIAGSHEGGGQAHRLESKKKTKGGKK